MSNPPASAKSRRSTPVRRTAPADSRDRLLQAATELLSERGLEEFRVVDVAAKARANVALINYHFGSRDGLLDEVIRGLAVRIGSERRLRLQRLLDGQAPRLPTVEMVIRCWLEPMVAVIAEPGGLGPFRTMIHLMFAADVSDERKNAQLQGVVEVTALYLDQLERILPHVDRANLTWRMLCAIGGCYLVLGQATPVGWATLSGAGRSRKARRQDAIDALVAFISAGISAPTATAG